MTYYEFIARIVMPVVYFFAGMYANWKIEQRKTRDSATLRRDQLRKQFLLNTNILKSLQQELPKHLKHEPGEILYDQSNPIENSFYLNLSLIDPLLAFGPITFDNNQITFEAFDTVRQGLHVMNRKLATLEENLDREIRSHHVKLLKQVANLITQIESLPKN